MMLTCKTSLACAFALISSVSAGLIPGGIIGGDSLAQLAAPLVIALAPGGSGSCGTGLVPVTPGSNTFSAVPGIGDLTSVAASDIVSTTAGNGAAAIVGNTVAVIASSASGGISALTNGFPGFTNSIVLSCVYGDMIVSPASNGIEVPVDQAASAPSCFTAPSFNGEHILIMIGPDPHGAQTLHFVQPGELSSPGSVVSPTKPVAFSSSEAPAVKYLGPAGSGLDTYTLLLFHQPADFKLSDFHDSDRYGFDITTFASKHALGVPVAAIYFVSGNKNGNGIPDGAKTGKFHNGTISSTNGTLHGSYGNGNGTNNSTVHSGNFHGNTSSSSNTNSLSNSNSSADPSTPLPSGNIPVSPYIVADTHSLSKASAYAANFALAGFVALISVGVLSL